MLITFISYLTYPLRFLYRKLSSIFQQHIEPTPKEFHDHKVYEVIPDEEEQLKLMKELESNSEIDVWVRKSSLSKPIEIMVEPAFQAAFETILDENNVEFKVLIEDLEETVERERLLQISSPQLDGEVITFNKYLRYSEIQDYLHHVANTHSNLVHLENYGYSYESRDLTLLHISTGIKDKKPAIFIDAGIHAREWIAPAQALYIIHELLESADLIKNVDWFVVPLLNPDGYEYSHTNDRFWRKTCSRGKRDKGVDANRNFNFHWGQVDANKTESSGLYPGPRPFSEPETLALSKTIKKYSDRIKLYITFHSAAQCILYPWGYTYSLPDNFQEHYDLAHKVAESIQAESGRLYEVGSSAEILARVSGTSRDWAKGVAGINLSYTFELPGGGEKGFDLPPNEILHVVEECFKGVKVFHEYIQNKFTYNQ